MPIRVAVPIPLAPPPPPAHANFEAVAPPAEPPLLAVPYVRQEQNEWCWAACSQMVAAFLGNTSVQQCELANFLHGQTTCCQEPSSDACNQPCPYDGIPVVYGHLTINCLTNNWPVSAAVVLNELTQARPVEAGLEWYGGGGHVVIIRGVTTQGLLAVNDPWYGAGYCTYLYLYAAYGQGRWTYTFGDFRNL